MMMKGYDKEKAIAFMLPKLIKAEFKPLAGQCDKLLSDGMVISNCAEIVDYGHRRIRLFGRKFRLRLLQHRDDRASPRRELHKVERQPRVLELLRPPVPKRVRKTAVLVGIGLVTFALIPDRAAYRVGRERLDA